MDDRIMHDPHLEVMPDHAGPHYDVLRNALTQNGMQEEQAIQALNNSWTLNHDARVLAWDQQVADDAAAAALAQPQLQQPDQPMAPPDPPVQEEEGAEGTKKKLKMRDFDSNTTSANLGPTSADCSRLQQTTVVPVVACSACSACSACREGSVLCSAFAVYCSPVVCI